MKITVVCVGKKLNSNLIESVADYEQRLRQYVGNLDWIVIPASDKVTESQQLVRACKGLVVLLDENGKLLNNSQVASLIESYQNRSVKEITFIIGGSYGVDRTVHDRADVVWSLSPLVFPHQIVRVLLVEQLYRTYNSIHGGKYHHK